MTHLMRVEAVNLAAVMEDTDQLSVMRGASLLLRRAVRCLPDHVTNLQPISVGASVGIFRFEGDQTQTEQAVLGHLAQNYPHFTFVVDTVPETTGFRADLERLVAKNRWRQYQQPTVCFPAQNADKGIEPCGWDGMRPADANFSVRRGDKDIWLSEASRRRYEFGKNQRYWLYKDETEAQGFEHLRPSDSFDQIAQDGGIVNLDNKLAVLYLDGNKFGSIQRERCHTSDDQQRFDEYVLGRRKELLKDLTNEIAKRDGFQKDSVLRFETLLWGGDEMEFVAPAWEGLWLAQRVFELARGWRFPEAGDAFSHLTHAAGLVFCNYKTPIHRVRALAHELAQTAKDGMGDKPRDALHFMVLESVDFPTQPVSAFWEQTFGTALASHRLPLAPFGLARLDEWQERLAPGGLPQSQVQAVAQAILADTPGETCRFEEALKRLRTVAKDEIAKAEPLLEQTFPQSDPAWRWLHLTELWDYLALRKIQGDNP